MLSREKSRTKTKTFTKKHEGKYLGLAHYDNDMPMPLQYPPILLHQDTHTTDSSTLLSIILSATGSGVLAVISNTLNMFHFILIFTCTEQTALNTMHNPMNLSNCFWPITRPVSKTTPKS